MKVFSVKDKDFIPRPHPLREEVAKSGHTLWMIRNILGGYPHESALSRMLNGIDPMKKDVEKALTIYFKVYNPKIKSVPNVRPIFEILDELIEEKKGESKWTEQSTYCCGI